MFLKKQTADTFLYIRCFFLLVKRLFDLKDRVDLEAQFDLFKVDI